MQLNAVRNHFEQIGVNVAAITIDRSRLLRKFADKHAIGYPLLFDRNSKIARAFGVRDRSYRRGDQAYGVPRPGIAFIDNRGKIAAKAAVRGFRERPKLDEVYRLVVRTLGSNTERRDATGSQSIEPSKGDSP